jgi:SPP1 family predicted phage head-tail adaptor
MRADMTSKVSFLMQNPDIQNSYGETTGVWNTFKSDVWVSKEPLLGNEYYTAVQTQSKVEVKFRTYYFDGVTNEMRIQHGTEVYEILSAVNVKSLNRELLLYCKKVIL